MATEATAFRRPGKAGDIAVSIWGGDSAPAVLMTHSILTSGMMWDRQAALLAANGYRAVVIDTRGHGGSAASEPPYSMDDLAGDTIVVMDGLKLDRAHYVGLSLGGMSRFALGVRYPKRISSMVLCDARADAPAAFAALWDERIEHARQGGCEVLAQPTILRWFGRAYTKAHPGTAQRFMQTIGETSLAGFIGCARAIQKLDYLDQVGQIRVPLTLIVGGNDEPLPDATADIQRRIARAKLEIIPDGGHLPHIDQPDAFDSALLRRFERCGEVKQ